MSFRSSKTSSGRDAARRMQAALMQGVASHRKGDLDTAQGIYRQLLAAQPEHFDALHLLGVIALQRNDPGEAVELISRAIKSNKNNANAFSNLGNAFQALGQHSTAIEKYDRAIALEPNHAEAHNNRGNSFQNLGDHQAAVVSYDRAIAVKPDYPEAHNNRGNALQELGRHEEAVESYGRAVALKADFAEAYNNRANAFRVLNHAMSALENSDKAVALRPSYAEAHNTRGIALHSLGRFSAAIDSYDRAIALLPTYANAYYNRGTAFQRLGQYQTAAASFDRAAALLPGMAFLEGTRLHTSMHICDWNNLDARISQLVERLNRGEKVAQPFDTLSLTDALPIQHKAAAIWTRSKYSTPTDLPAISKYANHDKVRVGYLSPDYREHPVAYLTAELFELHDRSKFDVVGLSYGPDQDDGMRRRISAAFDRFFDIRNQSDREVALLCRRLELDIAVDLNGFTGIGRPGIFMYRAAPAQVSYLGYPGTMAANFVDYLIADRTLIPEESQHLYSEKIVFLPNSYQANDRKRDIAAKVFSREELGLPAEGFVFCCFNNSYKITPKTFDGWMRILRSVGGSVLWLLESSPVAAANLRNEAIKRGVSADRLVFAKRLPLAQHLARHRAADLFLDTLPCNAFTTASDALWAGLPVLTCVGEAFASRGAASLLNAIRLPELVTTTQEEYEALAVELGTNRQRLRAITDQLHANRHSAPLFDTTLFTRDIEGAYAEIHSRIQAGLPPEDIYPGRPSHLDGR